MKEEWRTIKDFPDYEVSNFGRVRRKFKNKNIHILTLSFNPETGYLQTTLNKQDVGHTKNVHSLILKAFKPKPINKDRCNHIDGNKTNNHYDNLEWVTAKENTQHAVKHNLMVKGSEHSLSKLTENDVKRIRKLIRNGVNQRRIAEHFKVSYPLICRIKTYKRWKHVE